MKVLFQIRSEYMSGPAGDSIQMLKTKEYLGKLGVRVDISTSHREDLSYYDIIHIFNVTQLIDAYYYYKNAIHQKKRIVISPIFIDMGQYYKGKYSEKLAQWRSNNVLRREILEGSDLLLPNSKQEMKWIEDILGVMTPHRVIYNGIDKSICAGEAQAFVKKYGHKDFILCVGRISPIKNQLSLIRALKNVNIPLVLIGPVNNKRYAEKCAEEAGKNVFYIPPMDQSSLSTAYKAARVHVQPSWFETCGLSSLEAAGAGIQVVVTDRGAAKEYFGDHAFYCSPEDIDTIRSSILEAYYGEPSHCLQQEIIENFTWEKTAAETLKAYEEILEKGPRSQNAESISRFFTREYKIK